MRFAGSQIRNRRFGASDPGYRAQSGANQDYYPQRGDAGMPQAMTGYQAPRADQIAVTEMPAAREPAYNLRSYANPDFKAPGRV